MTDLPLVSALRERMQWHQARQKVLAENVANANTPGFKPQDLRSGPSATSPGAASTVSVDRTNPFHLAGLGGGDPAGARPAKRFETTPSGNAVNLEDEMMKVADNQSDYQLAATLYQKSLALLRTAAGARGR